MQINGKVVLGENVATTQSGQQWKGGKGVFMSTATFGGGTVKLQIQMPDAGGTWIDVKNPEGNSVSLTAAGMLFFDLPAGQIRVNIATATAVYSYAIGMHQ